MSTAGLLRRSASLTDFDWPSRSAARVGTASPTLSEPSRRCGGSAAWAAELSKTAADKARIDRGMRPPPPLSVRLRPRRARLLRRHLRDRANDVQQRRQLIEPHAVAVQEFGQGVFVG